MSISNDGCQAVNGIIGDASNIRTGSNPPFLFTDFTAQYPQFGPDSNGNYVVPQTVVQMYIDLASSCIQQARWQSYWHIAIGWFVAHFCTMYLQGTADPNSGAGAVLAAGKAAGLNTSESVGDVSASIDYDMVARDLDGWAAWKLTVYGQQLATVGKLVGKGGMYVW